MRIKIAHSPDADDYFLFWAIRTRRLSLPGMEFVFSAFDTEELNSAAQTNEYDVIAISSATLPEVIKDYFVLSSGASVGRNYGPKLIARKSSESREAKADKLRTGVVGIPGRGTTAALLLKHYLPGVRNKFIPLSPFRGVFDRLESGEVDAAVVIHEGQLTYSEYGCELIEDLGEWWFRSTGLPLPVGINVIRRDLGDLVQELSQFFMASVRIALESKPDILPFLADIDREQGGKLRQENEIDRYLSLYANEDSYCLPEEAKRGLERFLNLSLEGHIV